MDLEAPIFFTPTKKFYPKPKFSSQPKILGGGCGRRVVDVEGRVVDVEGKWWMHYIIHDTTLIMKYRPMIIIIISGGCGREGGGCGGRVVDVVRGGGCGGWVVDVEGRVVDVEGMVVDVEGGWWMWRECVRCGREVSLGVLDITV